MTVVLPPHPFCTEASHSSPIVPDATRPEKDHSLCLIDGTLEFFTPIDSGNHSQENIIIISGGAGTSGERRKENWRLASSSIMPAMPIYFSGEELAGHTQSVDFACFQGVIFWHFDSGIVEKE